jgi:hypothetical protein
VKQITNVRLLSRLHKLGIIPLLSHKDRQNITFLPFICLWFYSPLLGFDLFFQFLDLSYTVSRILGRGISLSQGRYLHTGQSKHRINAHRYPCLKLDWNPRSHVRASKDSSCLRPRGHGDRPLFCRHFIYIHPEYWEACLPTQQILISTARIVPATGLAAGFDSRQGLNIFVHSVRTGSGAHPASCPRNELSSLAWTLGSWVRIPIEAWMSVCVYSVFMLSCVQVAALRRADPPSKESYRLCKRSGNRKSGQGPTKGRRAIER